MSTTRVMPGIADQTGKKVNSLRVEGITSRTPLRYAVQCEICSARTTESHQRLISGAATCRNSSCGKPVRRQDRLADERHRLADREGQRRADELAVSEARMAAETQDYERPERYTPSSDEPPMTDRDRRSLRQFREEEEAAELERQRPIKEAERRAAEQRETAETAQRQRAERQRRYWREWVESDRDPQLYVTPELLTASMPTKEAGAHNAAEVEKFIQSTPEFDPFRTPGNADKLLAYLDRNSVRIFDAAMLKAAFIRLRDLGVLTPKPAPAPQPAQQPQRVNLGVAPSPKAPSGPRTYIGRDYATGQEREFSQREVDRMSSLEYQRAFQVVPTISELFTVMSQER